MHEFFHVGGGVSELTFIESVRTPNATITVPASSEEGDLAILVQYAQGSALVTPSGWTIIEDTGADSLRVSSSYKILTSSDPGSSVSGMDGSTDRKIMKIFRPDEEIDSVTVADKSEQITSGVPSNQTVQASLRQSPVVVCGISAYDFTLSAPPLSSSPTFDHTESYVSVSLGTSVYNSSPVDHVNSAAFTDGSTRILQSFSLSVS